MKEKIKRILDLIRAGKLSLDDAAPLLAALNTKLALQSSDRELLDSLMKREDLDSAQVAEHLMLLRGLKDTPPTPPQPPRPPSFSFGGGWESRNHNQRDARAEARQAREQARQAARGHRSGGIEGMVERMTDTVERAVETAIEGVDRTVNGRPSCEYQYAPRNGTRILRIEAQSEDGDSYDANLPTTLATHLHKLIPEHGRKALEKAGLSIEALQLIIEAQPPSGKIIDAQDEDGNSVSISIK